MPVLLVTQPDNIHQEIEKLVTSAITWNHPDVMSIDVDGSIGIDAVRDIITFSQARPYDWSHKLIIVPKVEMLTIPAQHALLKTLEEHPDYVRIFLCTSNPDSLLETIRSRVVLITGSMAVAEKSAILDTKVTEAWMNVDDTTSHGQKIALLQPHSKNRDAALSFVLGMIEHIRTNSLSVATEADGRRLELLLNAHTQLTGNAHVGLAMNRIALLW